MAGAQTVYNFEQDFSQYDLMEIYEILKQDSLSKEDLLKLKGFFLDKDLLQNEENAFDESELRRCIKEKTSMLVYLLSTN